MEFWGVEVKAGEPVKCEPGDKYIHLSQASLGEVKKDKGNDSIPIFVKIGDQKLVLGTLSPEKCTHISFDLVFEREFELSHNYKSGSVYFCGYKTVVGDEPDEFTDTDSDSGEDVPVSMRENGKVVSKQEQAKPAADKSKASKPDSSAAKPKVQIVEPSKAKEEEDPDDDESDDEEGDDESEADESDDEDMAEAGDESDEDEESSDEEDEATPKKVEKGKKRAAAESASKTPVPEKKAKLATPVGQKIGGDGKKGGGHIATPHPLKQAGKTPANNDKSKQQTPKSGGQFSCKSCSKTFNSDIALQSHTKAKHSGGK